MIFYFGRCHYFGAHSFLKYADSATFGLKPPRLDRCSICWALQGEIEETDDVELKSKLQKILDEHRKDAFQVRDYVYTSFQKSYAQLGKPSMNLETLEECID